MKGNGSWRHIMIIGVTIACLWLVFPTLRYSLFVANGRPSDAAALAEWENKAESLRVKAIPLGLDIQGGVDVVLEIDSGKALTNELESRLRNLQQAFSADKINAALEIGKEADAQGRPPLQVKVENSADYRRAANLVDGGQFNGVFDAWDKSGLEKTGEARLFLRSDLLQNEFKNTIDGAVNVIRDRVDGFGITQASVSKQGENRIRVQIPGERDPQQVIATLVRGGQLSFHLVRADNQTLRSTLFENQGIVPEGKKQADLLPGKQLPSGCIALPGEFGAGDDSPMPDKKPPMAMYVLNEKSEVTGKNLDNAFYYYDPMDPEGAAHQIHVEFDKEGARIFRQTTRDNAAQGEVPGRQLAIVLDNIVRSAPELKTEIPDGRAVISGSFSQNEASDLSKLLKYGALPADLKPSEGRTVEATLGADSIQASLRALMLAAVAVAVFMIGYYGTAGALAIVALILNILMIVAFMGLSGATLTLSGIGGIILTLGMGVDGNVLIYERMREEVRAGKPMKAALAAGFRRAFSVILDSHITVLLTALALLQFGTGSVRGFALTMTFGLLANLYTGLAVTYALCEMWFRWRGSLSLGGIALFQATRIDFVKLRIPAYFISAALLVGSLATLVANGGPRMAVDFEGGVLAEVVVKGQFESGQIDAALLKAGLAGTRTQMYSDGTSALIRAPLKDNDVEATQNVIRSALMELFGAGDLNISAYAVTPEVGKEFSWLALETVFWASLAILAYLWFRFEVTFGVAAVVALIHVLFITLGLITLMPRVELSLDVMSAFLILLGYSVNDTIVVMDRLRENAREHHSTGLRDLCNASMNQSLSRTFFTGLTTFFCILCMLFFGGTSLYGFSLTLAFGMIIGTYSSGFVALALVYEWTVRMRDGVLALAHKKSPTGSRAGRGAGQRNRPGGPALQQGAGGGGK